MPYLNGEGSGDKCVCFSPVAPGHTAFTASLRFPNVYFGFKGDVVLFNTGKFSTKSAMDQ